MSTSSDSARGFATAAAVHTNVGGLDAAPVEIPTPTGELPAYVAKPEGGAGLPIILIAQEIFGLHEHIRDIARRFAKLGLMAVAPDYFFRFGDPSTAPDIAAIRAIVMKVPDGEIMADFDAALAFAGRNGGDLSRAAVTGFCWGGRVAWLYAAHNPGLRACLPFYGRLDGEHSDNQPTWPIDAASTLAVPTLGFYGGRDPSIPLDLVAAMRARLSAARAPAEIVVYDDAPHAFLADYRESYREAAAKDAWARAVAFLEAHGVG